MQLEAIEPAHRAFALGRPSFHRLVGAFAFDVAGRERRGVYDGYARAPAEGASLHEQQQVDGDRSLPFHETVVEQPIGKILTHMVADVAEVKRLEVTMPHEVEKHEYGHHLAVRHLVRAVAVSLARAFDHALFQRWLKIFAKLVHQTKNFD